MKQQVSNLFQDQPWYIKLWRYRHYLRIPYNTIIYRYFSNIADKKWKHAYSIAIGDAQIKMRWLYTLEEVRKLAENKRKK